MAKMRIDVPPQSIRDLIIERNELRRLYKQAKEYGDKKQRKLDAAKKALDEISTLAARAYSE